MKKISIFDFSIIILAALCLAEENNNSKHDNNNQQKSVLFQSGSIELLEYYYPVSVESMVCDFCAQAMKEVFMKKKEVVALQLIRQSKCNYCIKRK